MSPYTVELQVRRTFFFVCFFYFLKNEVVSVILSTLLHQNSLNFHHCNFNYNWIVMIMNYELRDVIMIKLAGGTPVCKFG